MGYEKTVRQRVTFEGDLLRDALTEYLRNRGHDVCGDISATVHKMLSSPTFYDAGSVTLEWDGIPVEKKG